MPDPVPNYHYRVQVAATTRSNVTRVVPGKYGTMEDAIKAAALSLEELQQAEADGAKYLGITVNISRRVRYFQTEEVVL